MPLVVELDLMRGKYLFRKNSYEEQDCSWVGEEAMKEDSRGWVVVGGRTLKGKKGKCVRIHC